MRDSELPRPIISLDLKSAIDPRLITNLDVAQDSSFHQQPSFAFDPNLESVSLSPVPEFNRSWAFSFAQDPELPLRNSSQDLQSMVDNFAQGSATQHQDLQSKPGLQANVPDQSGAFDIDRSEFKLNQFVKVPGFPQTPLSASGHEWKQNQLTENKFDTLGREGLPEHPTYRNPVSNSSHISSSVAFVGSAQNLEASVEGDDLLRVEIEVKQNRFLTRTKGSNVALRSFKTRTRKTCIW